MAIGSTPTVIYYSSVVIVTFNFETIIVIYYTQWSFTELHVPCFHRTKTEVCTGNQNKSFFQKSILCTEIGPCWLHMYMHGQAGNRGNIQCVHPEQVQTCSILSYCVSWLPKLCRQDLPWKSKIYKSKSKKKFGKSAQGISTPFIKQIELSSHNFPWHCIQYLHSFEALIPWKLFPQSVLLTTVRFYFYVEFRFLWDMPVGQALQASQQYAVYHAVHTYAAISTNKSLSARCPHLDFACCLPLWTCRTEVQKSRKTLFSTNESVNPHPKFDYFSFHFFTFNLSPSISLSFFLSGTKKCILLGTFIIFLNAKYYKFFLAVSLLFR